MISAWILGLFNKIWRPVLGVIWVLLFIGSCYIILKNALELRSELIRSEKSIIALLEAKDSLDTKVIEMSTKTMKQVPAIDSAKTRLQIKDKDVKSYQRIKGSTKIEFVEKVRHDTIIIRDTVYNRQKVEIKEACASCAIEIINDTARGEIEVYTDLEITGYRKRAKRWFWNFRWGKNGWDHYVNVYNRCDSNWIVKENLMIIKEGK